MESRMSRMWVRGRSLRGRGEEMGVKKRDVEMMQVRADSGIAFVAAW